MFDVFREPKPSANCFNANVFEHRYERFDYIERETAADQREMYCQDL